jgi:glycerol-3-phosphate dehydrogenase (NAD+)
LCKNIAVVGGGNFGTAISRRIAKNVGVSHAGYHKLVYMWLMEEIINGRNLTDIINADNVNVKYLPDVALPKNLFATSNIKHAVENADVIFFAVPHQFMENVLSDVGKWIKPNAICISLVKGINIGNNGPLLMSNLIKSKVKTKKVGVLMGANVANDIARDDYVEATVAFDDYDVSIEIKSLLDCSCFHIDIAEDISTVEICGALKNVVCLGAGDDGLLNHPYQLPSLL